jgi:hypothetical protein
MRLGLLLALVAVWGLVHAQRTPDAAVQLATDALSRQLGIAAADLRLANVSEAEWRDSSLGCPGRGVRYTPSLVAGFKVLLQAGDLQYEVHTSSGRAVVCGNPTPAPKTPQKEGVKAALDAAGRARRLLATTLGRAPEDVIIKRVRPWQPDDAACEPPAGTKSSDTTYLVELAHDARPYRYRATPDVAWPCGEKDRS